jgi:hypothetical protein
MPRWETVVVEFTSSELELLTQEAAACGVALAEFIHDAALARAAEERVAMAAGPRFNRLT